MRFSILPFLCISLFMSMSAAGQDISGYAIFVKEFEDFDNRALITDTLYFNGEQLLYIEKRDKIQLSPQPRVQLTISARDQAWYLNTNTGEEILQKRNTRKDEYERFLSAATPFAWEIHDEYKTIGDQRVQKATAPRDDDYEGMTAWFTTEIPISAGPYRTWGLPGLILELKFNYDFRCTYRLQSIVYQPVGDLTPTEGEIVEDDRTEVDRRGLRELLNRDN